MMDHHLLFAVSRFIRLVGFAAYGLGSAMVLAGVVWAVLILLVSTGGVLFAGAVEHHYGR